MGRPLNLPGPETGVPFVDTHCHVADKQFKGSLPPPGQQLAEFRAAGGRFLIVCSIDLASTKDALSFARTNEGVYFSCGWAPQTVTYTPVDTYEREYERWKAIVEGDVVPIVAFGEIGLDFHHAKTLDKRERQIAEFDKVLSLVAPKQRPIVLHVRNAGQADTDRAHPGHVYNEPDGAVKVVLEQLSRHGVPPKTVLFHCYSGPATMNDELVRAGFLFSVPSSAFGIEKWNKVSRSLPVDQLVTETDSPFQHPTSMEPVNAPVNVRYAVAAIAHARGLSQRAVGEATVANARAFFHLP